MNMLLIEKSYCRWEIKYQMHRNAPDITHPDVSVSNQGFHIHRDGLTSLFPMYLKTKYIGMP